MFCSLSAEEKELLKSVLKEEEFPAGKVLQRQGHPSRSLWFVSEGFIIGTYKENEQIHTSLFCPPGEFAVSIPAFFQQGICSESLTLGENSILLTLNYENFLKLRNIPSISRAAQGLMARHQLENLQRIRSLSHDNPTIRLQKLLQRYPSILKSAHTDEIASYLGVSRRALYRMLL